MAKNKLGVIVGNNRRDSINHKLAQARVKPGSDNFDAKILQFDDVPMFSQDHEKPLPAGVERFTPEIQFKPELIDAQGHVTDESVRKLLKAYIDQFATFAARCTSRNIAAAA